MIDQIDSSSDEMDAGPCGVGLDYVFKAQRYWICDVHRF